MQEANLDLNKLEKVFIKLHELFIENLDPKEFELYIEPQVKDRETAAEFSAFERLDNFIVQAEAASMLVAGDPGMGKTLLSRQIAQRAWYLFIRENIDLLKDDYWTGALATYEKQGFGIVASILAKAEEKVEAFAQRGTFHLSLPIWLWIPSLRGKKDWESQLLERHLKSKEIIELLKQASQQGICRLFPIMDGWDELQPVSENLYLKSGFWDEGGWPYLKVLSTCRPEAFIYYEKRGGYKSIFHPRAGAGTYTILNLCPFEARHIQAYIECYVKTLPVGYQPKPVIDVPQSLKQLDSSQNSPWNQQFKEKWMAEYNEIYAPISAQKTTRYQRSAATSDEKDDGPIEAEWMAEHHNVYATTQAGAQSQQSSATSDEENNDTVEAEVLDIEQSQSDDWTRSETYTYHIARIQGLEQIIQTPFVLSAVVQVLPCILIQRQREEVAQPIITRYKIYEHFVNHWLTIQAERLWEDQEKQKSELNDFFVQDNEDQSIAKLKACLLTYCENLARLALNLGSGKLEVNFSDSDTLNPNFVIPILEQESHFKNELDFSETNREKLRLIRSACLLKNLSSTGCDLYLVPELLAEDNIHPNLTDCYIYLTGEAPDNLKRFFYLDPYGTYESVVITDYPAFEEMLMKIMSGLENKYLMPDETEALIAFTKGHSRGHFKFLHKSLVEFFAAKTLFLGAHIVADNYLRRFDLKQDLSQLSLNHHVLVNEPNLIHLLADKSRADMDFKYLLYQIIELSKGEPAVEKAAANAISILNVAGESFSGRDFRAIHIRGAILNGALCSHTDFEGADLRDITAHNIWLQKSNLSCAQVSGFDFQELPRIKHDNKIKSFCLASNGEWLLIGDNKGYVTQYSYPKGKLLQKWYSKPNGLVGKAGSFVGENRIVLVLHPDDRLAACGGLGGSVHLIYIQRDLSVHFIPPTISKKYKKPTQINLSVCTCITFCHTRGQYLAFGVHIRFSNILSGADECYDHYLQIWDIKKRCFLGEYEGPGIDLCRFEQLSTCHQGHTLIVRMSPLLSSDGKILLFSLSNYIGGSLIPERILCSSDNFVLSRDEKLLAVSTQNIIELYQTNHWELSSDVIQRRARDQCKSLAFNSQGNLIAVRSSTQLAVWDLSSCQHLYTLPIPEKESESGRETGYWPELCFLPHMDIADNNNECEQESENTPENHENKSDKIPSIAGRKKTVDLLRIFLSARDTIYIWPLGRVAASLYYQSYVANLSVPLLKRKIEFSEVLHTSLLSIRSDIREETTALQIQNAQTKEMRELVYKDFSKRYERVPMLSLSINSRYLLSVRTVDSFFPYEIIEIWDLQKYYLHFTIKHSFTNVGPSGMCCLLSDDDEWLISASQKVFIHRLIDGKKIKEFSPCVASFISIILISALALSKDKNWLVVAGEDYSLSIFNVETQRRLFYLSELPIIIRGLDITTDGHYLVAKGPEEGKLIFRVVQEENKCALWLIHNTMELNLVCGEMNIEAVYGLSQKNQLLVEQNNAQGTPAPLAQLVSAAPEEKKSSRQEFVAIGREFCFDRAVVKCHGINSFFRKRSGLNYDVWQVALVRDDKAGKNSRHTFILIEGMNAFGHCFFWRFDLVTEIDGEKVKEGYAEVVFRDCNNLLLSDRAVKLKEFLNPHEIEDRGLESLVGHVWQLKREKVLDLYKAIMADQAKGLLSYAITGNQSFFSKGENCYSWARRHLLALKDERIEKNLPSSIVDYFAMNPAWKLQDSLTAPRPVQATMGLASSMST